MGLFDLDPQEKARQQRIIQRLEALNRVPEGGRSFLGNLVKPITQPQAQQGALLNPLAMIMQHVMNQDKGIPNLSTELNSTPSVSNQSLGLSPQQIQSPPQLSTSGSMKPTFTGGNPNPKQAAQRQAILDRIEREQMPNTLPNVSQDITPKKTGDVNPMGFTKEDKQLPPYLKMTKFESGMRTMVKDKLLWPNIRAKIATDLIKEGGDPTFVNIWITKGPEAFGDILRFTRKRSTSSTPEQIERRMIIGKQLGASNSALMKFTTDLEAAEMAGLTSGWWKWKKFDKKKWDAYKKTNFSIPAPIKPTTEAPNPLAQKTADYVKGAQNNR